MSSSIFSSVPSGRPSLREAYEKWAEAQAPHAPPKVDVESTFEPSQLSVGIVGGGISGLYSALLLKRAGIDFQLFEANPTRLGGRVYTHRFNDSPNQYFEAGAMRLPEISEQKPVFDLIDYLNERIDPGNVIKTIPYVLYDKAGNLVRVNGKLDPNGRPMSFEYAETNPTKLGFSQDATDGMTATELLDGVIGKFLRLLEKDFDAGFREIVKYDDYSFHSYLAQVEGWTEERINYVEVMTSQTNQFQQSFTELLIENMDFSQASWRTIENGMDRLTNAMVEVAGKDRILMGASVTAIEEADEEKIQLTIAGEATPRTFDRVIMALPPAALHMIKRPVWSPAKTHAIRALHFEPLYKIGLRFKTRFWEKTAPPAKGGQTITDLPSRWFVYPSYGIGDEGPGVLLLYSWMTDAVGWLSQSSENRARLALRDLQTVYGELVDINAEFIEAFEVNWTAEESTGDAMFFPGQFRNLFNVARTPEGHVYFAGEHLSVHHTWIVGAIDSAIMACQQLLGLPLIVPLGSDPKQLEQRNAYDYSDCLLARTSREMAPST